MPKGSVLGIDDRTETAQTLQRFSKKELQMLALIGGTSQAGTKEQIAKRFKEVMGVRGEISKETVESLEQKPGAVLRRYLDALNLWKGGNKHSHAVGIINWRTKVRAEGRRRGRGGKLGEPDPPGGGARRHDSA